MERLWLGLFGSAYDCFRKNLQKKLFWSVTEQAIAAFGVR